MSFIIKLERVREILERQGRVSTRALERELQISGEELDDLIEELVEVQQVAHREGRILVWTGGSASADNRRQPPDASLPAQASAQRLLHAGIADRGEARKSVTIVFADLIGSTALHERLDAESVRGLMERYYRVLRDAVEAHGGTVVKLLGDGVMAAFGVPRVAEDDAIRAVRAAVAIAEQVSGVGSQVSVPDTRHPTPDTALSVRVAVNTGEVVVSADNTDVVGDPVNVAARLQQEAHDGEVLIGESTRRLVGELVTLAPAAVFALRGRLETVAAYRVVSLERPAGKPAIAFVGRDDELRRLTAAYDSAVAQRRARLAVILGSAGLGKSRLLDEFGRRLGDGATVLNAHCEATGAATFAPIAEALREFLSTDDLKTGDVQAAITNVLSADPDRERICRGITALLAGTPASPEETFFVVRRFLAALPASHKASQGMRPVVLAIDDLQWAEPLLLDLVEHLVQWGTGIPLLVLTAARPDLREVRSSLARAGDLVQDVVTLAGLDAAAATRLVANVLGAAALPAAVAGRVLATSEGNPLFVGELVRMLVNDGALKQEGNQWTTGVELATLEMPPTIHALLAARIERLAVEDRTALERAAVIGRQFSRAAVAHLLPAELRGQLDARLEALRRSELIEPDTTWFLGEPALRFHHGLTRDAAYRRVLKGTRAELHGRFADWVESRVGKATRTPDPSSGALRRVETSGGHLEHDETIGWHLEQAHQNLRELGPLDAQGRAFGARASGYLAAAGRRALARDDLPVAADLLGRAVGLLDSADPARADLALDWCEALLSAGDVAHAQAAIDELARFATAPTRDPGPETRNRLKAWHTCFAGERAVLTNPETLRATADAVAAAAEEFAAMSDAAGEAKAHFVHAMALARLGKVGACEAALDKALAAARRGEDRRRSNAVLAGAPLAALWGPSPVTRASGRCLDVVRVLRITQGAPAVEAVALRCQAVLEALRGRADAARHMIDSSRRMVEELGITQAVLETEMFAGLIALFEGDNAAAERSLRSAYEGLRAHGLGIDAARAAALLGRSLLAQGRAAEAEALSHESEALAGDDLQAAITWRRVRAEALAQRGEDAAAVELARAAVDIAAATDALLHHADARLALAAALRATGRHDDASVEEKRAIELWAAKGATILAERARVGRVRIEPVEITRGPPARHSRRRVRENAATANADRFEAAMAARNADAVATHMADSGEVIDHRTGAVYRRPESLASFLSLFRTPDGSYRTEPLATLGDSLALCRQWSSGSALATKQFDVGSWEAETVLLIEADAQGQRRLTEVFHAETLGDAVARLYERYGELLPEGSARVRAAATGRAVAALAEPPDLGRWAAAIGPAIEATDHRTVGFGSLRGADAVVGAIRALVELGVDNVWRFDDILDLRPDGFVVRWTESGTDRATGGAFERKLCQIFIFGADGLVARWEQFDADSEAAGLARFDELMTQPVPRRARRVRPNTATAYAARLDAAMAARDVDALAKLEAEDIEVVDHPAGTTYGAAANLAARRMLLRAENLKFRHEPLASLGDSLALLRLSISASGVAGGKFDVGAYERDILVLAGGKRSELFAADKLGDAVVRLYERYAELLPDDSERRRIATSARALAAHLGPLSLDRLASSWVGAVEFIDHRIVGFGSVSGVQGFRDVLHTLFELAHDLANRVDDILDLRADAALLRVTNCGTDRAAGGTFERPFLMMWVFRPHGGLQRIEQFDLRQETEALARFDELVGNPPSDLASPISPQPFANAVTRLNERFARAWAARDWDAVAALHAPALRLEDRRRLLQMEGQAETNLAYLRVLFDVPRSAWTMTPIATRGERLALSRYLFEGDAAEGGGALAIDYLGVDEVGSDDRFVNVVLFDPGDLDAAYAELDECYAAGEGAPYAVLLSNLDALGEAAGAGDREAFMGLLPEDFRLVIHRRFADPGAALGRDDFFTLLRTGVGNLDVRFRPRTEHVLRLSPTLGVFVLAVRGTMGGGDFEISLVNVLGHDGSRPRTLETFDPDQLDAALARYEALSRPQLRPVPRRVRPNAATATAARADAAIAARDVDGFLATWADDCEAIDHPTGVTYGLRELGDTWRRALARAPDLVYRREELATLGEKLALFRQWVHAGAASGGKFDVGEYEIGQLFLNEVDEEGRCRRSERFAVDRLRDAIVRLYERYAETLPEGPEHTRAAATARSIVAFGWDPDAVDGWYRAFAPDVESVDHRILGTWSAQGAEAVVQHLRSLLDLVDDFTVRWDEILALRSDACVVRVTTSGTNRAGGGAYERPYLGLWVFGADGLITRWEQFDIDRGDEAFARFDELTAVSPAARFGNAATRTFARAFDALNLQDWKRFAALFAPGFRSIDRRTMLQSELDRDKWLASYRPIVEMTSPRSTKEVLATRGDRVLLARYRWEGSDKLVGPSEIEYLLLIEVDGRGDHVLVVMFDPDDLDAAYAELDRRFYVGEAAAYPRATELLQRLMKSAATHDWEEFASVFAPDLVFEDHRPLGWGTLRSPGDFVTYVRTLADLAPDVVPRFDHVLELDDQRGMAMMRWVGSRDGGAFEIPVLGVVSFDPEGRIQRLDVYNPDQLDEARARFEQLPG